MEQIRKGNITKYHSNEWVEIKRTEVIEDNLNPVFVKSIITKYFFEERQRVINIIV